jgi:hypothetical protein
MLFTFIDLLHKVLSHHTFTFSSCFSMVIPVLGLITNLGETGCYILPLPFLDLFLPAGVDWTTFTSEVLPVGVAGDGAF